VRRALAVIACAGYLAAQAPAGDDCQRCIPSASAAADDPLFTTYAAPMSRSRFFADKAYFMEYFSPERPSRIRAVRGRPDRRLEMQQHGDLETASSPCGLS